LSSSERQAVEHSTGSPELQSPAALAIYMRLPETQSPGALQAALATCGVRMTRQRRIILAIIELATQHMNASQILRKATKLDPGINRVTVYRTLNLLKRYGPVDALGVLPTVGSRHLCEQRPQRDHLHMTCLRCGKVQELESELLDRVKSNVERGSQFHIIVTRLEIGGYCEGCQKTSENNTGERNLS